MEQNVLKHVQQNILETDILPIFADEVLVAHTIKAGKEQTKGTLKKEAHLFLLFIDATNHKPVAKIAISPLTARALQNALNESLGKVERELKSKNLLKRAPKVDTDYIR